MFTCFLWTFGNLWKYLHKWSFGIYIYLYVRTFWNELLFFKDIWILCFLLSTPWIHHNTAGYWYVIFRPPAWLWVTWGWTMISFSTTPCGVKGTMTVLLYMVLAVLMGWWIGLYRTSAYSLYREMVSLLYWVIKYSFGKIFWDNYGIDEIEIYLHVFENEF